MKLIQYVAAFTVSWVTGSALAGAGQDQHGAQPAAAVSTATHDAHWMAPPEAAKRKNPVPKDAASRARGKMLYVVNCMSCHGIGGSGDGPAGRALNPKPADLARMAGQHSDGDFSWKIANGRGAMPAWKGMLTDKQIWDVVNYVKSLGAAKKPRATMPSSSADRGH